LHQNLLSCSSRKKNSFDISQSLFASLTWHLLFPTRKKNRDQQTSLSNPPFNFENCLCNVAIDRDIFSILEYQPYNYNKICRREHSLYSHAHATNISCTPWPNPIWELDQKLVWTFNPIYNLLSCATTLAPTPFIIHTPQKIT